MPSTRTLTRAFNGGELSPEMFGKVDDGKYGAGLALCRNFITLPHGPAQNRAGFEYVLEVKDSTKRTRIIPFSYSTTQTMVIELGAGYFRFHTLAATLLHPAGAAYNGATAYAVGDLVLSGGTTYYCIAPTTGNAPPNATYWYAQTSVYYEIPNPYAETDLFDVHYVQSNDVMTLTHPGHPPMELRRYGSTDWRLVVAAFSSSLVPPAGLSCTATVPGGATNLVPYKYVVTAVDATGLEESAASASVTTNTNNNLLATGAYNTIAWSAAAGATYYNVYKESNGLYGYIGQTPDLTFKDDNITADLSGTPPQDVNPFTGAGNYPTAVTYYEQRRAFAGTVLKGQTVWLTRSATESNMNYSIPSRDTDAITFKCAAREANTIRHLVPLSQLIALTSSAEWRLGSATTDALTPSSVTARPQSYVGASNCQPIVVENNNLLFVAARGGHMREMAYNIDASGYITGDVSLRAPHLFDGYGIVDMAYQKAPYPIVWSVSSSGDLLGLTYVPEQQIGAWHRHDTQGAFESVCVVSEDDEEALYVVTQRTINGSDVRFVERMRSRLIVDDDALADCFFVDCGLTYSGAPATTITGLDWLEGEEVSILTDGAVHPRRTVTGGEITLERAASKVHVGLPITADLQTLPVVMDIPGLGSGIMKNVNHANLRVFRSSGIFVGPDADTLTEAKQRTTEDWGTPPALKSDEIEVVINGAWTRGGQVFIRQSDPLPLTLCSLGLEVELGT